MASESDLDDLTGVRSTPSPQRKDTEFTVRRLADSISVEDADRASRLVREAITQQQRQLAELQRFSDENKSLSDLVLELPDSVSHRIMVPFGKAAFFPGRLIHTNEFLVLLGENHYAECSAKQTVEILERRGDLLDQKISGAKAQVADLKAEHAFVINTAEEAKAGLVEIREEYQGSGLQPNPESISRITAAGSHFGSGSNLEATTSGSGSVGPDEDSEHDHLMARLSELERAEAAAETDEAGEDSDGEVDDETNAGVFEPFRPNLKKSEVFSKEKDFLEEEYDSEEDEEEDGQLDNSDDEEYDVEESQRSSDEEINRYESSKPGEKQKPGPVGGGSLSRFAREVHAKQGALDPQPISQRVTFQQGSPTKRELQSVANHEFPSATLERPEGTQGLQKAYTGILKERSSAEPATANDPQIKEAQQLKPISAFTGIVTEHSSVEPATANEPQVQEAQQSRPISKFKMRQAQVGRSADNEMVFEDRVQAVEVATQFQNYAKQVQEDVLQATDTVKTQVILAREWLKDVTISKEQIKYLVMEAMRGACQGHRAELMAVRVARAFAALEGRDRFGVDDLKKAEWLPKSTHCSISRICCCWTCSTVKATNKFQCHLCTHVWPKIQAGFDIFGSKPPRIFFFLNR